MKRTFICIAALLVCLAVVPSASAQWSSDPAQNLPLADNNNGSDQVQPKVRALSNGDWYVSWFDADPSDPNPGYDVFLQRLNAAGYEQFPHGGILVADLTNSSTEDYGLDIDVNGNALLAFLDTRESENWQVTAAKMDKFGNALWGTNGVQLTNGPKRPYFAPKITGTNDGNVVVAWTSKNVVMVQKLDPNGNPLWPHPIRFSEAGYNYLLADLHAADNGSVIVSWERDNGFFSDHQLRANKLSSTGKKMWGKNNVTIFDEGSLQFGEFPYFILDGSGGAIFAWYTNGPTLQCFAQHIRADGSEAFPHNGSPASTNLNNVRVDPSVSYNPATDETFLFWTEEDQFQTVNGVYGQKFDGTGAPQWTDTGLILVPLGSDQQSFVENVQLKNGVLVFWVDSPGYGVSTMQAAKLSPTGHRLCAPFPVSSTPSNKYRLSVGTAPRGLSAVSWTDDRIGNNAIYIQNVNSNCSLGQK